MTSSQWNIGYRCCDSRKQSWGREGRRKRKREKRKKERKKLSLKNWVQKMCWGSPGKGMEVKAEQKEPNRNQHEESKSLE